MEERKTVNIIGAGIAGLSAAITLAKAGINVNLISSLPSERAQSVLAEGGINAALDTMGENDSTEEHFADTMRGGCFLESEHAVRHLTEHAPDVVRELVRLGVPFRRENGQLVLRHFGGQKKRRTAYAKSSTGKIIMTALIDETRRYETEGLIRRYSHHELIDIKTRDKTLKSVTVRDTFSGDIIDFYGPAILCTGGLNGFFEGATTGTTQNTGNAAAIAFGAGLAFSNLEFIQYHPTTARISDKRMLISEAARGEGGRLFTMRKGLPWYFMEEKYPELGNLMPRDVISREIALLENEPDCSGEVFLDMTGLAEEVWKTKLSDLRKEILDYLHLDPGKEPVPVGPGIHFFMGGIWVNDRHETNIRGLFAAGEAACKYHGANRLGGNSMLGAAVGGWTAANYAGQSDLPAQIKKGEAVKTGSFLNSSAKETRQLRDALLKGLGIIRTAEGMEEALAMVRTIAGQSAPESMGLYRARLGEAMILSALAREESRGAHYRLDYLKTDDRYRRLTIAEWKDGAVRISFVPAGKEPGGDKDGV